VLGGMIGGSALEELVVRPFTLIYLRKSQSVWPFHQFLAAWHLKSGILNMPWGACVFDPCFASFKPLRFFHPCTVPCHIVLETFQRYQVLSLCWVIMQVLLCVWVTLPYPIYLHSFSLLGFI
jgi:hypothetical protein